MNNIRTFQNITPTLALRVFVDPAAVVIGAVTLGDDASVWPTAVIRGDILPIVIGARSNVQDGCVLHTTHQGQYNPTGFTLTVGDDVTIGHRAVLHGCTVQSESLIGMSATILDNAVIETRSFVAAGSLVVPGTIVTSGWLWAGSPAKPRRKLNDEELAFFKYSAQYYVTLQGKHRG